MTIKFIEDLFTIGETDWQISPFSFSKILKIGISGGSTPTWQDIILSGNTALTLVNSKADGLNYLKLFGNCEQRNVPNGYKELVGISMNNNCLYQITDFKLRGSDTVRISFSIDGACNVFGCYQGTDATDNYDLYVSTTSGSKYLRYGNGTYLSYWSSSNLGQRFDVVFSPTGTTGMPQDSTWTALEFETANDLLIGSTTLTGTSAKLKGSLYGHIIVDGRLELIPVERLSDNEICYYDKVSGTVYEPTGTTPTSLGYATPTPTIPIDIICNNGVIKYGYLNKNLSYGDLDNVGYTSTGGTSTSTTFCGNLWKIKCVEGEKYTVSCDNFPDGISGVFVNTWKTDGTFNLRQAISMSTSYTYTIPSGIGWVNFTLYKTGGITIGDNSWLQVEKGNTATSYVKSEVGIYIDGTTETVCVKDQYNKLPVNAQPDVLYPVTVTSAGNWTASANVNGGQNLSACEIRYYNANKEQINYYTMNGYSDGRMYKTFPATTATKYVSISRKSAYATTPVTELKVETGGTMTPYYSGGSATAEMLLAVGNYEDEQEVLTGAITRNVGVKVLDGTETIGTSNSTYTIGITDKVNTKATLLCSHFPYSNKTSSQTDDLTIISFASSNIGFRYDACATKEAFGLWLKGEYDAGHPVTVVYLLATATTESTTAQTLTTQTGTNIVEITQASIDNLGLEVSYKAGVAVTITEVQNAQLDNSVTVTIGG